MAVNWARICKILTPFPRVQKQWGPSRYPHVNFSLHLFKKKTKLKILIKGKSRMVHFNIVTSFLSKETIKQLYLFNVWEREKQRDREREICIYILAFCLFVLTLFHLCILLPMVTTRFVFPFSRARIFFLYTMYKKEFLAAFYRSITSLFFCYRDSKTLSYSCMKYYLLILQLLRFGSGNDMFSKQSRE